MRRVILILCATTALLAACGGQGAAPAGPQTSVGQAATPEPPAAEPGGEGTAIAHVEIASGPLAGTYDDTGAKVDCNMSGSASGATHVNLEETDGLRGLTFVAVEGGANPGKFYFQALFADPDAGLMQQPALEINLMDPATASGSGTAQLEDKGGTIKWSVDGKTADGIGLKGSVECGPVDRN